MGDPSAQEMLAECEGRLRRTAAELAAARRELAGSGDRLAAFAGRVGHDLRGPMTGVIGFVEVLERLPVVRADERATLFVGLAVASGRRMVALLEALVTHARAGATLRPEPVDLDQLVRAVTDDLSATVSGSGATVRAEALPEVWADRTQLRAVLRILVSNAVAYRRPGRPARVELRARRQDASWRVEVVDNGLGIPADRRADALTPLVRLHSEADAPDAAGGTGLGLATCRRVVEAHGGTMGLADGLDGGTTAWFTLPDTAGG